MEIEVEWTGQSRSLGKLRQAGRWVETPLLEQTDGLGQLPNQCVETAARNVFERTRWVQASAAGEERWAGAWSSTGDSSWKGRSWASLASPSGHKPTVPCRSSAMFPESPCPVFPCHLPASAARATGAGGNSSGECQDGAPGCKLPALLGGPGPTSSVLCLSVSEPRVKVRRIKGPRDGPRDRILEPLLYSHRGLENLVSPLKNTDAYCSRLIRSL